MAYELEIDLRIRPLGFTVTLRVNLRIFMSTIRLGFYTTHAGVRKFKIFKIFEHIPIVIIFGKSFQE